jgi:hypothetical protein
VIPGTLNRISDATGKVLVPRRAQTAMFGTLLARALDDRASAAARG